MAPAPVTRSARRPGLWLTGALLVAAFGAAAAPGAERPAFSLAALRRDGVMIPFASYDGRAWSLQWPESDVGVPLPIALADIPKKWWGPQGPAAPWTAWLPGGETRPLTLGKPVHTKVFCSGHPAVATDYRGGMLDPRDPTVPKDGLAVAGTVTIRDITNISVHAPEAKRMIDVITDEFNLQEQLAADHFMRWWHPFPPAVRQRFPIELEALYRSSESTPRGQWKTTYVEAIRRFPPRSSDKGCGLITFVRGWISESEGKKPVINIGARVTYCDRAEVAFMLPFGRLLVDNEAYWVYQISSWRDEFYTVSRIRPDGVRPVVAVAGGGCPKDAVR
jgi:hypothetical protein